MHLMSNIIYIKMKIISFLLGFIISLIIILSFNSKRQDKSPSYKKISLKEYQELVGCRLDYHESENAIYGREKIYSKDVVSAEKTAIFVANVLYKHTGKENSNIKRYYITSTGKKVWKISVVGQDSLVVYIQKYDGRILRLERYGKSNM